MKRMLILSVLSVVAGVASAKLPPLSDDAKAKAAEAAARTAHGNKVADFQLCKSMNRTAAVYFAEAKKAGKDVKPSTATPDCADPGPFVAPAAASAPVAAPAVPAAPAAPAAAAKPAPKKT
jgi:hypothetical protein